MLIHCPNKPLNAQQFCDFVMRVMTQLPLEEDDPRIELRDRMSDSCLEIREEGEKVYYQVKVKKEIE